MAALIGVLSPDVYNEVISREVLPGVISQDILTIAAAILLLILAFSVKEGSTKTQIVILGLLGYLFYAYGIYAMERVYNFLYFFYLAIFGLSFYALIFGAASFRQEVLQGVVLSEPVRKYSVVFSLFIAVLFSFLWVSMLVPLIQTREKIEIMYSIFILDLSIIMPAFVILAILAARKQGLGLLLTPALYILGSTLLFPVGLGEVIKPFFDLPIDPAGMGLYLSISLIFLILVVIYLRNLKTLRESTGWIPSRE